MHGGGTGCHDAPESDIESQPFRRRNLLKQVNCIRSEWALWGLDEGKHAIRRLGDKVGDEKSCGSVGQIVAF